MAAVGETFAGNVILTDISPPVVGADPVLVIVTGISLEAPILNGVAGWPMAMIKSGVAPAATAVVGVIGVATLLAVTVSPVVGVVPAEIAGLVPTMAAVGVTGTFTVLLPPFAIGPAVVQFTVWPVVAQLQPLLLKVAGADMPVGKVIDVAIGLPVVAAVPMLATVIGTLLATPATNGVVG